MGVTVSSIAQDENVRLAFLVYCFQKSQPVTHVASGSLEKDDSFRWIWMVEKPGVEIHFVF
jgi:hypothetical protein